MTEKSYGPDNLSRRLEKSQQQYPSLRHALEQASSILILQPTLPLCLTTPVASLVIRLEQLHSIPTNACATGSPLHLCQFSSGLVRLRVCTVITCMQIAPSTNMERNRPPVRCDKPMHSMHNRRETTQWLLPYGTYPCPISPNYFGAVASSWRMLALRGGLPAYIVRYIIGIPVLIYPSF